MRPKTKPSAGEEKPEHYFFGADASGSSSRRLEVFNLSVHLVQYVERSSRKQSHSESAQPSNTVSHNGASEKSRKNRETSLAVTGSVIGSNGIIPQYFAPTYKEVLS